MRCLGFLGTLALLSVLSYGANPPSEGKIGYGSSTAVISPAFQENVFLGFELAFQKILGKERADSVLVTRRLNDKTIQGASVSAEALMKEGVVGLVGFPVSHDALLAADVAKKYGVLGIMGGAAHSDIAERGPLVYSTGAAMDTLLETLCDFLESTFAAKRGLTIVNPFAVFSVNQEKLLARKIEKDHPGIQMQTRRVNQALVLNDADLQELKKGAFDYLFVTLYPDDLVALFNQLTIAGVDLPMVAFGGPDPDILRRYMGQRKTPYYVGTTWVPGAPEFKELEKEMQKRYGRSPNMEIVLGYNLGLVVGQTVQRVKGPVTKASFAKAFKQSPCFTGLGGDLCFGPQGGHAKQSILRFVRFTDHGLELPSVKP